VHPAVLLCVLAPTPANLGRSPSDPAEYEVRVEKTGANPKAKPSHKEELLERQARVVLGEVVVGVVRLLVCAPNFRHAADLRTAIRMASVACQDLLATACGLLRALGDLEKSRAEREGGRRPPPEE
jgi:hypothetical protein